MPAMMEVAGAPMASSRRPPRRRRSRRRRRWRRRGCRTRVRACGREPGVAASRCWPRPWRRWLRRLAAEASTYLTAELSPVREPLPPPGRPAPPARTRGDDASSPGRRAGGTAAPGARHLGRQGDPRGHVTERAVRAVPRRCTPRPDGCTTRHPGPARGGPGGGATHGYAIAYNESDVDIGAVASPSRTAPTTGARHWRSRPRPADSPPS